MFDLTGKTAIVTGATRGLGKAIALKLAGQGANIAILCVGRQEDADAACAEIRELNVKCEFYRCDVSSSAETKDTVKTVIKEFGGVDILVNNAGITRDGLVLSMKEEDYDAVLRINLKGAFNMIKACYSGFIRKRSGKIVNISSVSGLIGNAGQANYSASKAGLVGLTKSVARELAERGVCCNAVAPGFIQTEMTANIGSDNPLMQSIPQKRVGMPDDIANTVLFLSSEESNYITGEVIRVDGGMAM